MSPSTTLNALCVLALTITAHCQSSTIAASPTSFDEPCAQVSAIQSSLFAADPTATASFRLPPDVAYACQQSIPLVKEDTIALLTGLDAWWEWQSTIPWLKNPPSEWPFPPVDLLGGLQELREQVEDGTITREIDFEWKLVDLITSARDGHFTFAPDAYSVFVYFNPDRRIVSISVDGTQVPEIFLLSDLQSSAVEGWNPSPIVKINGTDVVSWLSEMAFNETLTHQDLDTLYNNLFYTPSAEVNTAGNEGYFAFPMLSRFHGSSLVLDFKNGSEIISPLQAVSTKDFSGVVDGESFYQAFCNTTLKAAASGSSSDDDDDSDSAQTPSTGAQDPNSLRPQFPQAIAISQDASLAGYFLEDEPSVAVLSAWAMSEVNQLSVQQTVTEFLDQCRKANKTHLIVDVSQNGGGAVTLSYDIFKQLFPTLEPYLAAQFRANSQIDVLGTYFTPQTQQAEAEEPNNITFAENAGAFSLFDATSISNNSGDAFQTWDQLFGPVQVHGDSFSQQFQLNISDATIDEEEGGIVVSGYANNSAVAPQPFLPENMIIFSDGFCGSACTIFLHLLKYQAKVESIFVGGRPQNGPAQPMGGVKGNRVQPLDGVTPYLPLFYDGAPAETIQQANKTTKLKALADNADTIFLRNDATSGAVQVNVLNAIAQYDESQTPLQFVYEAADCRIWYQAAHILNVTSLWQTVAEQAFGLNGQEKFSLCVAGSTGHPSSLSGNQTLFQDGQIVNVTGYDPQDDGANGSSSSVQENGSVSTRTSALAMGMSTVGFAVLLGITTLFC